MFTGKEFVPNEVCKRVHGLNGIGEIELPEADKGAEEKDAAAFMAEMAQKYGKELVIVATAAMTNLARFIRQYPEEAAKVGRISVMGGAAVSYTHLLNVEDSGKYGLGIPSDENGGKCRIQVVDGEKGEVFELDFSDFEYAGDFKQSEKEFVRQQIRYAQIKDHILYLSIGHLTYAESSPHNAYVAAVDLAEKKLLWKSQPLVSNAANFVIKGDVLLCGYGFTAEPDYIYQLDLGSGKVIDKTAVKSKADYLILKDNILYVRTYNTDYTFRIE